MSSEDRNTPAASDDKPKVDEHFADSIDKDDPHKAEKLANAGKDIDAAEASE